MKVLGLSTMGSSAAVISIDGQIIAAIEEERLTRIKNDAGFPHNSIRMCLDIAKMSLVDIDEIAVYWQPWRILGRGSVVMSKLITDFSNFNSLLRKSRDLFFPKDSELTDYPELRGSWSELFKIKKLLNQNHGEFRAKLRYFDHHDCHAASIYYISGFDQTICLTYDGGGEEHSTVVYAIDNGRFEKLKSIAWPNSLGHFYSSFTGFLGFRMLEGEYKMMGLAPYGNPIFKDLILAKLLKKKKNGGYWLNTQLLNYHDALYGKFSPKLMELFGDPRSPQHEFTNHHKDIAASVQSAYEEILLHIISWARSQRPRYKNLCIAGGCGLNVTANGKIVKNNLFSKVLIPPVPHDAGGAMGAAFLSETTKNNSGCNISMTHPYLGKAYNKLEILEVFKEKGLPIPNEFEDEEVLDLISNALCRQEIVAWFKGRSEFGPRALGNRSFLADPRSDSIREVLNSKIKKRELFRPFAPSCKLEVVNDFFEIDQESPYMNIVASVKPDKRAVIPAVTHIDGTARVHTVDRKVNPSYWSLIDAFEKKSGVGVLLNTSFNIQEPIVENPIQAIDCFLRSSVDWLVLGPFVCDSKWREIANKKI